MIIGVDNRPIANENVKDAVYRSTNRTIMYCIMRVGKKYYDLKSIEAFEYHMERQGQIENADSIKSNENRILIGDANIYENLKQHIENVWKRSDSCVARDMILTSSPDFMRILSKQDFEKWLTLNVEWLKKTYGDNCIYCVLHMDETTPHLHCLISVDYTNSKGKRVMSDNYYFGGRLKLSELQTNYSLHIQSVFKTLNRGLKGSKAKHIDIRKFYSIVNKSLNEKDMESILAKAKNNELTEIKLNDIKRTLKAYKNYQSARDEEKEKLQQQNIQLYQSLKETRKETEIYKEGVKILSKYYNVPEKELVKILKYCKDKVKGEELEK